MADERTRNVPVKAPQAERAIDAGSDANTTTNQETAVFSGLTMVVGDPAGMCEGDACAVPWMMRTDDVD